MLRVDSDPAARHTARICAEFRNIMKADNGITALEGLDAGGVMPSSST